MRNRVFVLAMTLLLGFGAAAQSSHNWIERLNLIGMRHTQVFENDTLIVIITEAAQWRGTVNGIDKILLEVAAFSDKYKNIEIVMLDHGVPRVTIKVPKQNNQQFSDGLIDFSDRKSVV